MIFENRLFWIVIKKRVVFMTHNKKIFLKQIEQFIDEKFGEIENEIS